ncbi:glycosyltransferase family 4 protein [Candidatus Falkowbacteria bacterium]|nr:glycosyltransferase family 4 protein [Candidatus Falkowbacteria bacterium]
MKVAHIVCVFPPYKGGMGNSALCYAREMAERAHDITVFTPAYRQAGNGTETSNYQFKVRHIRPLFSIGNAAVLPQLIFALKGYDVLHLHYPFYGSAFFVWLHAKLNPRTRLVVHYHMDSLSPGFKGFVFKFLQKMIWPLVFKRSDLVTAASLDYVANSQIKDYYSDQPEKFKEIPFGVDLERFLPHEHQLPATKRVIFVGGLDRAHYFKGLPVLFEALALIKDKIDLRLTIIGSGDLLDEYRERARFLGIEDLIDFVGKLSDTDMAECYRQSDLFVLPSINQGEAFGMVLLEAMASGLPVIATNLPGVRKVFTPGDQGLLAEPGNVPDLAEKISAILSDNEQWLNYAHNARKLAEEKYAWSRIAKSLEVAYNGKEL